MGGRRAAVGSFRGLPRDDVPRLKHDGRKEHAFRAQTTQRDRQSAFAHKGTDNLERGRRRGTGDLRRATQRVRQCESSTRHWELRDLLIGQRQGQTPRNGQQGDRLPVRPSATAGTDTVRLGSLIRGLPQVEGVRSSLSGFAGRAGSFRPKVPCHSDEVMDFGGACRSGRCFG